SPPRWPPPAHRRASALSGSWTGARRSGVPSRSPARATWCCSRARATSTRSKPPAAPFPGTKRPWRRSCCVAPRRPATDLPRGRPAPIHTGTGRTHAGVSPGNRNKQPALRWARFQERDSQRTPLPAKPLAVQRGAAVRAEILFGHQPQRRREAVDLVRHCLLAVHQLAVDEPFDRVCCAVVDDAEVVTLAR